MLPSFDGEANENKNVKSAWAGQISALIKTTLDLFNELIRLATHFAIVFQHFPVVSIWLWKNKCTTSQTNKLISFLK